MRQAHTGAGAPGRRVGSGDSASVSRLGLLLTHHSWHKPGYGTRDIGRDRGLETLYQFRSAGGFDGGPYPAQCIWAKRRSGADEQTGLAIPASGDLECCPDGVPTRLHVPGDL
jgi:hypothetical protein